MQITTSNIRVNDRDYQVYFAVPQAGQYLNHALICFHGWVGNFQSQEGFGPGYLQADMRQDWLYVFPQDREGVWRGGSWWLGEGSSDVYTEVVDQIIRFINLSFGIAEENIAFWGSSMGGYGALYHGLKRNIRYVLVNVPQTNLFDEEYWDHAGQFLKSTFPDVDDLKHAALCYPFADLTNLVSGETRTLIDIETARFDITEHYLEKQVWRFCDTLNEYGVNYRLGINPVQMHGIIATPCEAARRWHGWQNLYSGADRYDSKLFAPATQDKAEMIQSADLFD